MSLMKEDHTMSLMKHASIIIFALALALSVGDAASAQQLLPPGASPFLTPPPPPPLPQPKIAAPVIPQMDAPIHYNYAPAPRPSFSDRISTCLDEGAASGLGPNDRATYSRSCANSR
jgi:hypothetical protein